jgi:branched-chain amino acid transport system permease protein
MSTHRLLTVVPATLAVVVLAVFPLITSGFFTSTVGVRALWLGIAAASLSFLAGYAGMVSLAQTALYGLAGFTMANLVASEGGAQHVRVFGLDLGDNWSPWAGALAGVVVATLAGLVFGAIASRSAGIYFLMITLALGVLTYYFFGQVESLSGFGGVNQIPNPGLVGDALDQPDRLYYATLITAAAVYALMRYVVRTPFGFAMQGIRDDPVRMRSLGYNVALHRTLAFGLGAFIASIGGIFSVWYNGQISPGSIDLTRTINILAIAVVGGLAWLEGAWLGAFAFVLIDYSVKRWAADVDVLGGSLNGVERFETWFGVIFLIVILLSPGGLMGIWTSLTGRVERALAREPASRDNVLPAVEKSG